MEYLQYKAFFKNSSGEEELFKFWVDDTGEVDLDNLPSAFETARLLQALRLYSVHVEFTGKVEDDE